MRKHILAIVLGQIFLSNSLFSMDHMNAETQEISISGFTPKEFDKIEERFHKGERRETLNILTQFFKKGNVYSIPYLKELSDLIEDSELKTLIASYTPTSHSRRNFESMKLLHDPTTPSRKKITTYQKISNHEKNFEEVLAHYGNAKYLEKMAVHALVGKNYDDAVLWQECLDFSLSIAPIEGFNFGIFYWNMYTAYKKTNNPKAEGALYKAASFDQEDALRELLLPRIMSKDQDLSHPFFRSSHFLKTKFPNLVAVSKIKFAETPEQYQEGVDELSQVCDTEEKANYYFLLGNEFFEKEDMEKAAYFIQEAAKYINHLEPEYKLGLAQYMHQENFNLQRNDDFIFQILTQIENDLPDNHLLNLLFGMMHTKGFGTPVNYEKAYQYYSKSLNEEGFCDNNDPETSNTIMAHLATLYQKGQGVPQDFERAISLMEKAIENGGPSFISYNRAIMWYEGHAHERNISKAIRLALPFALEDQPEAQSLLGLLYQELGDSKRSLQWFHMADQHGDLDARYHLIIDSIGKSDSEFPDVVSSLYQNIKNGHDQSRFLLGHILFWGHEDLDVERNFQESRRIMRPLYTHIQYKSYAIEFVKMIELIQETQKKTNKDSKKIKREHQSLSIKNIDNGEEKTQRSSQALTEKQRETLAYFAQKRSPMKKEEFSDFLKTIQSLSPLSGTRLNDTKSGSILFTEDETIGWHRPHKYGNQLPNATTAQVRKMSTQLLNRNGG